MVVLTIVGLGTKTAVELTVTACEDTAGTLECAGDRSHVPHHGRVTEREESQRNRCQRAHGVKRYCQTWRDRIWRHS